MSWVSKYVGGDGATSRHFEESFTPGQTVRDVLRRYSSRFPELDAALWDEGRATLGPHIEVLVNDAVLGVAYDLDTPLTGGRADHAARSVHGRRQSRSVIRSFRFLPLCAGQAFSK